MNRNMPGLPVHHQLPEFTQTHVHRVSDATQPSHPLSSPPPPAPNPSQHQSLFQWVNSSYEVAKVLEFSPKYSASVLPMNTQDWSFRMDWLDFLAVQGALKSLLQHHSSKASIVRCSAFFTVQLSHPYMTTGKKDFKCLFYLITHFVENQEITDIVLLISPSLYELMYLFDKYWLASHCVTWRNSRSLCWASETFKTDTMKIKHWNLFQNLLS